MIFKSRFFKCVFCLTLLFQLSGMTLPGFVSKANALFWEDDSESNDPKERKRRPDHFSLFDWTNDVKRDAKKREYRQLENRDNGPSVNNDARTLEIVSSGVLGLTLGLVVASSVTTNSSDRTANLFIGGALGFGFGIGGGEREDDAIVI